MNFDHIFNWKLLNGSHDFPGPEGGTCINEAAIVAAGFKYKKVDKAEDCPPCFSRVLSSYALQLNDCMPDDLRQKLLMPFVTRLAGTADTLKIELQRAQFITVGLIRRVVPIPLQNWKPDLAAKLEAVKTMEQAQAEIKDLARALDLVLARVVFAHILARALDLDLDRDGTIKIFEAATQILDDAMSIGKRAEPIETVLVETRMEAIKALAVQ